MVTSSLISEVGSGPAQLPIQLPFGPALRMTQQEELHDEEEPEEPVPPGAQPWRGPQKKLNKFGGSRSEYRGWCDEVQAILLLHSVPEDKHVLLLDLALEAGKGRPRDLFSSLTVDEVGALTTFDV